MVVRMRHTRAHTANRRSHHALEATALTTCQNCGAPHKPHHMCTSCGFYKGRIVLDMTAAKAARTSRMTARKEALAAQSAEPAHDHDHDHAGHDHAHDEPVAEAKPKKTRAKKAETPAE